MKESYSIFFLNTTKVNKLYWYYWFKWFTVGSLINISWIEKKLINDKDYFMTIGSTNSCLQNFLQKAGKCFILNAWNSWDSRNKNSFRLCDPILLLSTSERNKICWKEIYCLQLNILATSEFKIDFSYTFFSRRTMFCC